MLASRAARALDEGCCEAPLVPISAREPAPADHYNPTRAQLHLRTKNGLSRRVSAFPAKAPTEVSGVKAAATMSTALAAIFRQAWSQERYFSTHKYQGEIDNFL